MNNKKVFFKNVLVGTSREKGSKFLYIRTKKDEKGESKLIFINLIKDGKKYIPSNLDGVKSIDVNYTSYNTDYEKGNITLFNVSNLVYYK